MNKQCAGKITVLSIEDCQRLDEAARGDLELLDYEVRRSVTRILADVTPAGADDALFLRASSTVLLSIAAGLMERAAHETQKPFDAESFVVGAKSAAQWAETRKLRYALAPEV